MLSIKRSPSACEHSPSFLLFYSQVPWPFQHSYVNPISPKNRRSTSSLTAHLDTQWRWEYPRVINEYIPKTLHDNFALLDKYPNYVFNFSGANRYRMMKEYWPADYARLKQYVAAGRWFPAGSSMEEGDVNVALG